MSSHRRTLRFQRGAVTGAPTETFDRLHLGVDRQDVPPAIQHGQGVDPGAAPEVDRHPGHGEPREDSEELVPRRASLVGLVVVGPGRFGHARHSSRSSSVWSRQEAVCHDARVGEEHLLARAVLDEAFTVFDDNVRDLTLEEFLDAQAGYRSILGLIKHTAGWTQVYHSYAFEHPARSWEQVDWPRGLRDTIDPSDDFAREVLAWLRASFDAWRDAVAEPTDLASVRPLHWGDEAPLREIVAMVAGHITYHA